MSWLLEFAAVQKQVQTVTPQVVQFMQLLQMGMQELTQSVQQELLENPTLDAEDLPHGQDGARMEAEQVQWMRATDLQNRAYYQSGDRAHDVLEQTVGTQEQEDTSLYAHLAHQLHQLNPPRGLLECALFLAGSLNRDGWLDEDMAQLAGECGCTQEELEQGLRLLQSLQPAGVGGRTLAECLELQLGRAHDVDPLAYTIVREHLQLVGKRQYSALAKLTHSSLARVQRACQTIQGLNPRPGQAFDWGEPVGYIYPDVTVQPAGDHWEVVSNNPYVSALHINDYYAKLLQESEDAQVKEYLGGKIQRAKWMIQALQQREETLVCCVRHILRVQEVFFSGASTALAPLTMADLAQVMQVHESTVSRMIKGKYLQCPQGVFPLSHFFCRKISGCGQERSAHQVKARIGALVEGEDRKKPLSDQKLWEQLEAEGYQISRRTVAKYREELGIPSAAGRRA